MEGYPSSAKSFSHSSFSEVGELYGGVGKSLLSRPRCPPGVPASPWRRRSISRPRVVRERCLEDTSALNVSRVAVLCDVMGVRRKNAFTPEVSAGLRRSPIRPIDADERLLQCAYREPDADCEVQADHQPDDEPFASITHGEYFLRAQRSSVIGNAERVLGEATFDHRSVPPRRFSRPTRAAASCVPLRTDRGPLSSRLPFHGRIKALDLMSTYSRDWSRMGTKAIVLSATRDSGRLVPSRARPFAFSLLRRELQAFRCFVSRQAELGERRRWWH